MSVASQSIPLLSTGLHHRKPGLDVLRATAVLLVLGNHMFPPPDSVPEAIRLPFLLLRHIGWIGVDLFFVLSGFLVSGLLFRQHMKTGHLNIAQFYIRRAFKILPPLYTLVLATVVINNTVMKTSVPADKLVGEVFFLQNYLGALWGHTWTLAVEEHFYILLPIVLVSLAFHQRHLSNIFHLLPKFFVVLAVVELGLRFYTNLYYEYSHGSHLFRSHLRFDSLMFGVVISYFFHFHYDVFKAFVNQWKIRLCVILALPLVPLLLTTRYNIYTPSVGLTLNYLLAGTILSWLLVSQLPTNPSTRFFSNIGRHSYSIYLWHFPVVYWVMSPLKDVGVNWMLYTPVYVVISLVFGVIMAKLVEFPVLYVRDRYYPATG